MGDYAYDDFRSIKQTSDGYKVVVKGQQKNLERSNPDDAEEIALIDQLIISPPRL